MTQQVEVLGIRHHGPGSARAVAAELDRLRPDAVLIEGPADADPLLPWAFRDGMEPPVALLGYAASDPSRAVFWPFAVFSPEWQAIRWALAHDVPLRCCDLPSGAVLAEPKDERPERFRGDPVAALAEAAGYDDPERWWEDLVEQRSHDGQGPFPALTEAMAAVREGVPEESLHEQRREAHMRQVLREVLKSGAARIAVVCGAWHAPALAGPLPPASRDAATLRGMPKLKSALSWVPWSHSHLAFASGYGAGVTSPGWYHHLFSVTDRPVTRWFTRVAGELRREDLPVSSAHVIEAVRLAETLAVLRGRPLAGLAEVTEATRAVLCEGDETALRLVTDRLVVGEALGTVPDDAPSVPLAADLTALARRLRLKQEPAERALDLDLRREIDLDRSRLLHRLTVLGVAWGTPRTSDVRGTGTFRESWSLRWQPRLAVAVVEASLWGTTVPAAATARLLNRAHEAAGLAEVTEGVEQALLADLPDALPGLIATLDARAAADLDVLHLMEALPALVRSLRYGDVRGTDTSALTRVADGLSVRISAALPAAVGGLDDDAAKELRGRLDEVHAALALRAGLPGGEPVRDRWLDLLANLLSRNDVHGLVAGRLLRLLLDADRLGSGDVADRLHRALSQGVAAPAKGAWVEGFLGGGGLLLAHDSVLLGLVDGWVSGLADPEFTDVLPLLRRTFSTFETGERRTIGERVRRGTSPAVAVADDWDLDADRAMPAVLAAARLLGMEVPG
jgi:hypothetical protein